jgi:beta-lactamase regulating signal transducer with metallopeptidase domain
VYVGESIPVTVFVSRHGQPDVHAMVELTTSAGILSQTTGTTNAQGHITVEVSHAPVGRVMVRATTGTARGQTLTHVIPRPTPFPWWIVGVLIGLLLLLVLLLVVRRRKHREPESTDSPESPTESDE